MTVSLPLKITLRHAAASPSLEGEISRCALKLARLGHITRCDVLVDAPTSRHRNGTAWRVRVDLVMPGDEVVVDREWEEDPYEAVRRAFDVAARQVTTVRTRRLARRSQYRRA